MLKTIFKNNTGHQVITHNFGDLPLDDEIPWEVQVDPYDTAGGADPTQSPIKPKIPTPIGGNSDIAVAGKQPSLKPVAKTKLTGTLVPQPPDKGGSAWSGPVTGYQQVGIVFETGGQISKMAFLMGQPASDSWQKMISNSCSGKIAGVYSGEVNASSGHGTTSGRSFSGSQGRPRERDALQTGDCR